MQIRAYWCDQVFSDSKKFPYGFSRSGVFSLAESEVLESKGCLFRALMDGKVFDPTAEDLAFVQAMNAGVYSFNKDTRIWSKYLFHQRRLISISGGWISNDNEHDLDSELVDIDEVSATEPKWEVSETGGNDDFLKAG
ncbi:DUF413 domain-containing protein [Aliikangiella marina]|uniref:Macrodomain Ori protein n=1 Tax=Aliikangiella marina TaxID=1712262 RepID=A0A545T9H8_9GAMM|nr:DUF413 domain-containing protein [Aliikangiella marina]TQV73859.1 DUF413 domain-containing protein [Aliikangiella marina]